MKLKIAHIGDILGMNFNIPYYQRGYRWEEKQVVELLDDLLEFKLKPQKFYCLQPLVVIKNQILSEKGQKDVYDVIDGQQRLTTLFLILNRLSQPSFQLMYERMDEGLDYERLKCLTDDEIAGCPDYFYLTRAISVIDGWLEEKLTTYPRINRMIEQVLIPDDFEQSSFLAGYDDSNDSLSDVRFIWYDASSGDAISFTDSIDVFKRLNYGKTSLTAAELIKALLFQCDVYEAARRPEMKQVAFRMSTEWDAMEKCLQDKFMWSMIKPANYDKPSHIDIVLSFVAAQLKKEKGIEVKVDPSYKDYDYLIFNKYFESLKGSPQKAVEDVWRRVQDVFAIFKCWYDDRVYYHLIGVFFSLSTPKDLNKSLAELMEKFKDERVTRDDFIQWLKREKIGPLVSLEKRGKQKEGEEPLTLDKIYYGPHSNQIVRILLLHNVRLCMEHGQDRQRFPFYFYRSEACIPSLEHIHPQHLHDEEIDFLTLCLWFRDKKDSLGALSSEYGLRLKDAIDSLNQVLTLSDAEVAQKTEEDKKSFKRKADFYEKEKSSYLPYLTEIDDYFDELAEISEDELHSIANMALVDKITNTRLGNGLMNAKRLILQELSQEYDESDGERGAVTFVGTWKVFNKEYSTYADNKAELAKSANLNFWTKLDRKNYLKDIKKTYDEYAG